jgi:hypothetical protein
MATTFTSNHAVKFEYMLGGGSPSVMEFTETSGAAWVAGAAVTLSSAGLTAVASGDATAILGFAQSSGQANSTTFAAKQSVVICTPQTVFSGCVVHATTASAVTQPNLVGKNFPLVSDCANGKFPWYVDIDGTTTTLGAYVLGMKDASGTVYGRVYFVVNRVGQGPWFTSWKAT